MGDRLHWLGWFILGAVLVAVGSWLVYQIPWVNYRLGWRLDMTEGVIRGWLHPGDTLPAPADAVVDVAVPTALPTRTPQLELSHTRRTDSHSHARANPDPGCGDPGSSKMGETGLEQLRAGYHG